jgi:aryl-alcohol dehydrogenase-like predicted oxidoreductase
MRTIPKTDLDVFEICLGGNVFGWTADREASFEVLDAYARAGGNFVDSADAYSAWVDGNAGGESETLIGEWMRLRGNREAMVVTTKIGALLGLRAGGLSADNVRKGADESLQRLGVDTIDLLYAHVDDPQTPLEETLAALDDLVKLGKVRYLGLSQYSAQRIGEWLALCDLHSLERPVALQPLFSLVERGFETELAPLAAAKHLGVMPYYALAAGFLTGKYRPGVEVLSARASGRRPAGAADYLDARGLQVLGALDLVAAAHDVPVASVALAWLLAQPSVTAPVASARTRSQLESLLPAAALTLSSSELEALDRASDDPTPVA